MRDLINLIENVFTKQGERIQFKRFEDDEGDGNRGWQVDKIVAYVNGQPRGYIKASYIPKERWEKYYHNIYNFVAQIVGSSVLPFDRRDQDYHTFSEQELQKHVFVIASKLYGSREANNLSERAKSMSRDELIAFYEENEKPLIRKYVKHLNKFRKRNINFPTIAVIDVDRPFRRHGLGRAMYIQMALWMAEKGMKLHASGLQTDDAQKTWEKMDSEGLVGHNKRSKFIVPPENLQ